MSVLFLPLLALSLSLSLVILVSHFSSSWHNCWNSHHSKLGYDPGLSCSVGSHVRWIDVLPLAHVLRHTTMMEDHRQPFWELIGSSTSWHKHRDTNFFSWLTDLVLMWSTRLTVTQRKQKMSFDSGKSSNLNDALFKCNRILKVQKAWNTLIYGFWLY